MVGLGDSIFSDGGGQQVLFWRAWEDGQLFIMTYQLHIYSCVRVSVYKNSGSCTDPPDNTTRGWTTIERVVTRDVDNMSSWEHTTSLHYYYLGFLGVKPPLELAKCASVTVTQKA